MSDSEGAAQDMERGILFAHLLEPTHVGAGEGLGTIDRPVFRESTTGYPTIPGSTLKGVTRAAMKGDCVNDDEILNAAFGTSGDSGGNQGCILWADFKLLFLPLRSLGGTFAWATSVLALSRFQRDLELSAGNDDRDDTVLQALRTALSSFLTTKGQLHSASGSLTPTPAIIPCDESVLNTTAAGPIVVEGFVLEGCPDQSASNSLKAFGDELTSYLYEDDKSVWAELFADRIIVLPEDAFSHACRNSLPVDANIRIKPDTGTTPRGSLRYTEFLPAETLMYSPLTILKPLIEGPNSSLSWIKEQYKDFFGSPLVVQFGADESKGKGVTQLRYLGNVSK